jgi:hypothetical protein
MEYKAEGRSAGLSIARVCMIYNQSSFNDDLTMVRRTHVKQNPHIDVEGYPVVIIASASYPIIPYAPLLVLELVLQRTLH